MFAAMMSRVRVKIGPDRMPPSGAKRTSRFRVLVRPCRGMRAAGRASIGSKFRHKSTLPLGGRNLGRGNRGANRDRAHQQATRTPRSDGDETSNQTSFILPFRPAWQSSCDPCPIPIQGTCQLRISAKNQSLMPFMCEQVGGISHQQLGHCANCRPEPSDAGFDALCTGQRRMTDVAKILVRSPARRSPDATTSVTGALVGAAMPAIARRGLGPLGLAHGRRLGREETARLFARAQSCEARRRRRRLTSLSESQASASAPGPFSSTWPSSIIGLDLALQLDRHRVAVSGRGCARRRRGSSLRKCNIPRRWSSRPR